MPSKTTLLAILFALAVLFYLWDRDRGQSHLGFTPKTDYTQLNRLPLGRVTQEDIRRTQEPCLDPSSNSAVAVPQTTPVLLILVDFSGQSTQQAFSNLAHPDRSWAHLMFGRSESQGNHYWQEVSHGNFQMRPAPESYGCLNDGSVYVELAIPPPQTPAEWRNAPTQIMKLAIDAASKYVDFAKFDSDGDGRISNRELSVLLVLNLQPSAIPGAAAEANIQLDHTVDGVVLEKAARTLAHYGSIGVNLHELAHHIFQLDHGNFGQSRANLMGMGAYNESSHINVIGRQEYRWGTLPAHPIGMNKILAGFIKPLPLESDYAEFELHAASSKKFNVIELPTFYGKLYLENRFRSGYDRGIDFGNTSGGVLLTRQVVFAQTLAVNELINPEGTGDYLRYKGHGDQFIMGGYQFSVLTPPGEVMRVGIRRLHEPPKITQYRYRYWVKDPKRKNYQLWEHAPGDMATIDATKIACSHYLSSASQCRFTVHLDAEYNTGDRLSVNHKATWKNHSSAVKMRVFPVNDRTDAIVELIIPRKVEHHNHRSAIIEVTHEGYHHQFKIINIGD